jgi:hypothetical protein
MLRHGLRRRVVLIIAADVIRLGPEGAFLILPCALARLHDALVVIVSQRSHLFFCRLRCC